MTRDRHRRLGELFLRAADLDGPRRAAFLERECADDADLRAEIRRMLEQDAALLSTEHHGDLSSVRGLEDGAAPPERIGRYRILRRLGEGGMGTVYEAEQEQPRRVVALKVIRPGFATDDALRRFGNEAALLGALQHPGIAQVFEAGTEDTGAGPQPYFAMELIHGPTLSEYVRRETLGPKERLRLVARVCDAVEHAHRKGVIHRDLKPGNILVAEGGRPKILDFGVARATDCDVELKTIRTDVGQMIGTLPYMSPEQVRARPEEIDARSDVYSLGVLTYELLADAFPVDVSGKPLHEAARRVMEDEPTRLGTVDSRYRGDVETIVAKALEKERGRRYASAAALAGDIRRFLNDEPIVARRPSALYQLQKLYRRHRLAVGAVVVVFVALATGLVTSIFMYLEKEEQRRDAVAAERRADRSMRTTAAVNRFLRQMLRAPSPRSMGTRATMLDVIDSTARNLGDSLADDPMVEAMIRDILGETYVTLDQFEKARPQLDAALSLLDDSPEAAAIRVNVHASLAELSIEMGDLDRAEEILTGTIAMQRARGAVRGVAQLQMISSRVALGRGDLDEAERRATAAVREAGSADPPDLVAVGRGRHQLGVIAYRRGDLAGAAAAFEAAIEPSRADVGNLWNLSNTLTSLSAVLAKSGRIDDAIVRSEDALDLNRQLLGDDDHLLSAVCLSNHGSMLRKAGRLEEAEPYCREALEMLRRVRTPPHVDIAINLGNLGSLLARLDRPAEGIPLIEESLAMLRATVGEEHGATANGLAVLSQALRADGRTAEAIEPLRAACAIRGRVLPPGHPELIGGLVVLGGLEEEAGDAEGAERTLADAHERAVAHLDDLDRRSFRAAHALGRLRLRRGDLDGAGPPLKSAFDRREDVEAIGDWERARCEADYGWWLLARGDDEAAEVHLAAATAAFDALEDGGGDAGREHRERWEAYRATR